MKRLKPILLGCSVLLLALCAIISLIAYLRRDDITAITEIFTLAAEQPYAEPLTTPDDILTYLRANPDAFGLVAYSVNPDGTPVEETLITHNPDRLYTLASTVKIVVLAAYAREVSAGRIDPDMPVPIAEWERFYLPDTDGGAHIAALNDLQIVHENGFAADTSATVPLDQIAGAMIEFSDNAATDVMLYRLGAETIADTLRETGITGQEPLLPISGIVLLWQTHEQLLTESHMSALEALPPEELSAQVWAMSDRLRTDDEWFRAEQEWRRSARRPMSIALQIRGTEFFPAGTARDYASIMARVMTDTFISADASAIMRRHLEWPMQYEGNQAEFTLVGNKGGSLASVLTDASYMIPISGDFAGQPRVVVFLLNDIPFTAWLTLSGNFVQQDFQVELARNQSFAAQVQSEFSAALP